jgi:anti-sigma factor (TIGR02949 family)
MDCQDARRHCQPFLDTELQPLMAEQVQQHLGCCPHCSEFYDSQRGFHSLVKKVLCRSAEERAIPGLKERIVSKLRRGARTSEVRRAVSADIVHLFPSTTRYLPANRGVAMAAACMLFLTGIVSFQSVCIGKTCSIVAAAQHEHDNIISGNRPLLVRSDDTVRLNETISKKLGDFASVPNLAGCNLKAEGCGEINLPHMPKGFYVKYVHCHCSDEAVTLMAIKTDARPSAELIENFTAARRNGRTVLAWDDGSDTLYFLVSGMSLDSALEVAKVAQLKFKAPAPHKH